MEWQRTFASPAAGASMHRILSPTCRILFGLAAILLLPQAAPFGLRAQAPPTAQMPLAPQDDASSLSRPATRSETHVSTKVRGGQLKGDDRLLQVLNRFTYGPRPGDLEHLRAIGLQAWFNQQLNPQSIDDSALEQRLAEYPAIQLPLPQMMGLFPNQQVIRRYMNGKQDRPGGEAEKAIYADEIFRFNQKKNQQPAATNANAPTPPDPPVALPFDPYALLNLSADQRFAALCKLTPPEFRALREQLRVPADRARLVEGFTPQQFESVVAFNSPPALIDAELVQTKLLRDLYSERQLNEVMTDFWLNHFNVYAKKSQETPYYIATYERNVIRPRALGNFESLLIATAMSPAMLNYLDNATSVGPHSPFAERANFKGQKRDLGLNENYARELMELQTVGVNGGYTQQDVTEVAKIFTGWTVGSPERGGIPVQAQFDPAKHEPGPKHVLGVTIKENGAQEGVELLHLLANSPRTAQFISTKLAIRFVSDDPPPALVDRMAKTFLSTHGDIRRVLLAMVNSPEFFHSDAYRAKVKTPQDFVLSAVRASGAQVDGAGALVNVIADLGMPIYGMPTPNGYSMRSDAWNNTAALVARLNFALALSTNRVAGVHTDWDALLPAPSSLPLSAEFQPISQPDTQPSNASLPAATALEAHLEAELLHIPASPHTQQAILAEITGDPTQQAASLRQVAIEDRHRDPLALLGAGLFQNPNPRDTPPNPQAALAAGLLFGSPEFQRR
jgi:uncharacterized protein (DUF1800 family)